MSDPATLLIVLWLFAIGGVIGSFLNVVVYRLPLGISLIHPPSHCPTCKQRIRWYDNVPIVGWIALGGRCRHCRSPISIRYPTVEAVTAATFGLLAAVEFVSQGANLPLRAFAVADNLFVRETSMGQLYAIYLYHLLLLCTLLCAAMIEFDGNRPPWRLFVPALAVGFLAPLWWPALRPVAAWAGLPTWLAGTVDGLAGLAAGSLLGGIAWLARKKGTGPVCAKHPEGRCAANWTSPLFSALSLACVGVFLGWQAVGIIAAATAAIQAVSWLLGHAFPKMRIPAGMSLGALTLVWILLWARLVGG
jgi:leader peptidase (prepilin peptidase) / N-methyltransferase